MIRRPAMLPDQAATNVFVVEGLVKKDAQGNETYNFIVEVLTSGQIQEVSAVGVKFSDNSPANISVIE